VKYAVLSCSGMDKAEGSLAREVAIGLSEKTGADIVCPVHSAHAPARYKKLLAEERLVVIDGCGTRCASKLADALEAKVERKVSIAEELKSRGLSAGTSLRLDAAGLALVREIVDALAADLSAPAAPTALPPASAAASTANWDPATDFYVVVHDKFEFRIPKTGYFFNENDVWLRPDGSRARIGISDYMQQRLTDINYFDPPDLGAVVEQFGEVGTVESAKAAFEVVAPGGGTVIAVNRQATEAAELINEDPYGRGWLVEIELTDWQEEKDLLIDGAAYAKTVERKAAEG
jgi:glycine cleavage system H protein